MLSERKGRDRRDYVSDYVIFDLETTGVSCTADEVIEISAVKVRGGEVSEEFSSLVNPGRPIPYEASRVNHITDEMVADAPFFTEVFADFLAFAGDDVLIGHNIRSFDLRFLDRYAQEYYGKYIGNDYVDTLTLACQCLPRLPKRRLTDLAEYYQIPVEGAHRALGDCRMNQKIYEALAKEMEGKELKVRTCPKCGSILVQRSGKYGAFLGCSGYPDCRYTENVR